MRSFIPIIVASFGLSHAERVEWIAEGQVTLASGVFGGVGIAVDDVVSVSFSYEDDAGFDPLKDVFGERDRDYYDEVELRMEVTIGARRWEGFVMSGEVGNPYTIFVRTGPFSERFEAHLREVELAEFPVFPLDEGSGENTMEFKIAGNPTVFLGNGIDVDSIDPNEITSATGAITTGGTANKLSFNLELDSIKVRDPDDVPDPPKAVVLDLSLGEAMVHFSWQSDLAASYLLQEGSGLEEGGWSTIETVTGTGGEVGRSVARVEGARFYRLVRE